MNIKRIVPNISSTRFEESKRFYRGLLGLRLAMEMDWIMTFVSESNPSAQITIVRNTEANTQNSCVTITIEVSDVDEIYVKANSSEFEITYPLTDEPWGVRRFFVKDPNEVIVNVMAHKSQAPHLSAV